MGEVVIIEPDPDSSCATCKHWHGDATVEEAECRRYPPQVNMVPVQLFTGMEIAAAGFFPSTRRDVFCGEYVLKRIVPLS